MSPERWSKADTVLVGTFILLVALSLVAPQYKITTTTIFQNGGAPHSITVFYYVDNTKIKSSLGTDFSPYDSTEGIGDVLALEKLALACSLFLAWMFLIVLVFGTDMLRITLGWMAMVGSVIAVAYPIVEIPGSLTIIDGFFGTAHEDLLTRSWSPSSGWYLTVIGTIFIGFVTLRRMNAHFKEPHAKKEEDDLPIG